MQFPELRCTSATCKENYANNPSESAPMARKRKKKPKKQNHKGKTSHHHPPNRQLKFFASPACPFEKYKNMQQAEQWLFFRASFTRQKTERRKRGKSLPQQQFSQPLGAKAFQAIQAAAAAAKQLRHKAHLCQTFPNKWPPSQRLISEGWQGTCRQPGTQS